MMFQKNMLTNKMVGPVADVTRADGYLSQLQTGNERTIFELNKVKELWLRARFLSCQMVEW